MKMGHWTLKTGKILRTSSHDNCCHGDKFQTLRLHFALKGSDFVTKSILNRIIIGPQIIGSIFIFSVTMATVAMVTKILSWGPIMATSALTWHTDSYRRMERGTLRYLLPWKPKCCHSNQKCATCGQLHVFPCLLWHWI